MKKCDTCNQVLPTTMYHPDINLFLGVKTTCQDCLSQYRKKLKPDEIDRNLARHNKKVVTTAWSQMPYKGVGFDIDFKMDITWTMQFRRHNVALWIWDSKGEMMSCSQWKTQIPLKQKIQLIVDFLSSLSVRLELSAFDREMSKRVIYIY